MKSSSPTKISTAPSTLTAEQVKKAEQVKQAKQEKVIALEKAQKAVSAKLTAESLEKLLSLLATGDRINLEELKAAGINTNQQKNMRKSAAFKESGIQCQGGPGIPCEYWIEPTS